ncbi:MAG: protein translocase subunit SecD, partial [Candidatus Krumholzibacteria bacterium]|nr:protein translocase subunit SecD [Candidatus Krumholzibacteria bacterium]
PAEIVEERTVGPSLGADSIRSGTISALVGLLVVVLFMVAYYRGSGLIADTALLLNVLFILAVLAGFHFTLTLPGIAGIILTMGMAVDANVLIYDRIKEELRAGKTVRASVDAGYANATSAILDANITSLISALVLYQFGTGPIRGFALTLSVGIVSSVFTALIVTKLMFDARLSRAAVQELSI